MAGKPCSHDLAEDHNIDHQVDQRPNERLDSPQGRPGEALHKVAFREFQYERDIES
jgi:hypothetical protein